MNDAGRVRLAETLGSLREYFETACDRRVAGVELAQRLALINSIAM
jgi:hypothetical protein